MSPMKDQKMPEQIFAGYVERDGGKYEALAANECLIQGSVCRTEYIRADLAQSVDKPVDDAEVLNAIDVMRDIYPDSQNRKSITHHALESL